MRKPNGTARGAASPCTSATKGDDSVLTFEKVEAASKALDEKLADVLTVHMDKLFAKFGLKHKYRPGHRYGILLADNVWGQFVHSLIQQGKIDMKYDVMAIEYGPLTFGCAQYLPAGVAYCFDRDGDTDWAAELHNLVFGQIADELRAKVRDAIGITGDGLQPRRESSGG